MGQMLTGNGIKQEVSFIFLHALVTRLGYALERTTIDMDSVDATICARGKIPGSKGSILSPKIDVQLKATEQEYTGDPNPFRLSKKNYDDLRKTTMVPKILGVVFLQRGKWIDQDAEKILLYAKGYWMCLKGMDATNSQTSVSIPLPASQIITEEAIQQWMIAAANREEFTYVSC